VKILLFTPSVRLLGARQSLLSLSSTLPDGIEPLVVCPGNGELTQKLQEKGVETEIIPHGAWRKATGHLKARVLQVPKIKRLLKSFRPDVIHCNEFHSTPQVAHILKRTPRKSTGPASFTSESGKNIALMSHVRLTITPRQIANYYMEDCDRIVAVSQNCKDLFMGREIYDRVDVVYNGIDVDDFFDAQIDRDIRKENNWSDDEFVVGLLGLVSPRKNQMIAIEALEILREKNLPVRLLLAGDPFKSTIEYGEQVKERIANPKIKDSVCWLPFQEDVRPLYQAMNANLLISAEEGFGRTIIEAGALSKPSIGSKIGGIPELIVDRETGLLVDEGNAQQLAEAIEKLYNDQQAQKQMGEAALKRVKDKFTLQAYTNNMIASWEKAMNQVS